jgi:hypothetical protein
VTDNNISSFQDAPDAAGDRPSSSVSAFVADAISEQRRIDGLLQLLADMAAVGGDAAEIEPTPTADAVGVS